jgi:hypothetical protein
MYTRLRKPHEEMRNMFKNESRSRQYSNRDRDRDQNRSYNSNNFRGLNEKKPVEVKLTEADFPELNNAVIPDDCRLNFKEAYLKEVTTEVLKDEPLPQGWVRYRVKNGDLIVDGESIEEEDYTPEECHCDATQIFRRLINRWNDYRTTYDELHGDGAYDRLYKMPQYESLEEEEYDEWEH